MLLLVNLGLIFLASSVLGRPSGFEPTIKRDAEANVDVDDSWKALYDGHQRYLAEMELNHPTLMKDLATNGQHPNFVVIACSDSRVAPEMVLNTLPGTIFSERAVANRFEASDLHAHTTLYYAVEHLHSHHIIVMGHYGCGGVGAAIGSPPAEPMSMADRGIQEWVLPIRDLYASSEREEIVAFREKHASEEFIEVPEPSDPAFRALVEENVKRNVLNVAESDFIHEYWTNSTNPSLWVHGLVYDMEYGGIVDLNITMGAPGASAPPPTHFPKWSPSA
uniref:Carbonic anhydrase n=1 Tax=Flammulina filiformis TaxID=2060913 RepID=A0A6G6A8S9_9AGAR|nr:carbonic anhydrase [Flammulina filiformis]